MTVLTEIPNGASYADVRATLNSLFTRIQTREGGTMPVLTQILNGSSLADVRLTFNDALARMTALESGATPTPTPGVVPPTPTADMLPALTTPGAAYHTVLSASRLLGSYVGPLVYAGPSSGSSLGDIGAGKADIAAEELPSAVASVHGLYDQTGNGHVPQQQDLAKKPRLRGEVKVGGRLGFAFFGKANTPLVAELSGGQLGLTAASRTEVFVIDPTLSMQTGVLSEHYTDAQMTAVTRDLFTSPGAEMAVNAGRAAVGMLPASPVVLIVVETAGSTSLFVNGQKYTAASSPAAPNDAIATWRIGASGPYGTAFNANFRLGAYASINAPISDADALAITAAMQGRFGLYTGFDMNLVHIGDSLVETENDTDTMGLKHFLLPMLNTRTRYWNLGFAGKTLAACYADRAKFEAKLFVNGKKNVALIDAGINDLGSDGRTGSSLYADVAAPYIAALKAFGFNVGITTILPQNSVNYPRSNASIETERQAYNPLVRANGAGADFVIDRAVEAHIGPVAAADDATLYGADKIHLTTLGYSYAAPVYAASINALV